MRVPKWQGTARHDNSPHGEPFPIGVRSPWALACQVSALLPHSKPRPVHRPGGAFHYLSGESVAGTLGVTAPSSTWKASCSICIFALGYSKTYQSRHYLNHEVFVIWNATGPGALVTGSLARFRSFRFNSLFGRQIAHSETQHSSARRSKTVKMIAEYLEHALQFERMAADEKNPELKGSAGKTGRGLSQAGGGAGEKAGLAATAFGAEKRQLNGPLPSPGLSSPK